ncbi:hypothetical protein [Streptomyces acidicola]|uniref:Uncharacterized protein n=1 Tax=Streptomyces acidicola TaxID=2596892 RepID=A0A5N8WRC0_9ACTN|nr:hypothetical protein [Streptomyces acidicola]MPY49961.1 hypothetical protein [Streptomyces acidicola]
MRSEENAVLPARWLMVPAGLDVEITAPRGGQQSRYGAGFASEPSAEDEYSGRPPNPAPPALCRRCGAPRPAAPAAGRGGP